MAQRALKKVGKERIKGVTWSIDASKVTKTSDQANKAQQMRAMKLRLRLEGMF
jgi:hypothetical protein